MLAYLLFLIEEHLHDAFLIFSSLQYELVGEFLAALPVAHHALEHDAAPHDFLDLGLFFFQSE